MIVPALRLLFPPDAASEDHELLSAALEDYSPAAVHEVSDREWRVFFRTGTERDAALRSGIFGRASAEPVDVPDDDWARRSQQSVRAVAVGRLVVAPPWDVQRPRPARGAYGGARQGRRPNAEGQRRPIIVIEPSMGFGTGHHATTRLCLRALQRVPLEGKAVLDVGTGSGVLAIAAALLGAITVVAIDNDPDAIAAARANVARNGVRVDLRFSDLDSALPEADVVVANLTGAALRRHAATLAGLAKEALILSGVLTEEADDVCAAFAPRSASIEREDEDGWVGLTVAKAVGGSSV